MYRVAAAAARVGKEFILFLGALSTAPGDKYIYIVDASGYLHH